MSKQNIILGFDVSSSTCSVAISSGQNILSYEEDLRQSVQAENLLPLIEKALKSANLDYGNIAYLAFTNGPGSFTGIRIGLASAEGIIISSNMHAVTISNFEMAYYRAKQQVKFFDQAVILLNAYRGQLYYQKFDNIGNKEDFGIIDSDKIYDLFENTESKKIVCAGNGISEIYDQIKDLSNIIILPRFARIKAIHICRYADEKINKKDFGNLEPIYIRPPDANPLLQ